MRRIALLTHGFAIGGGVPAVTRWLHDALTSTGQYTVDIHDLATSSRDSASRRLTVPASWAKRSLADQSSYWHWGANVAEIEFMRYRTRRELDRVLRSYDVVQVVAGGPAWAAVTSNCRVPVVLQAASLASWERQEQLVAQPLAMRAWRQAMTRLTSRIETTAIAACDAVLVENQRMLDHVTSLGHRFAVMAPPGVDIAVFTPPPFGRPRHGHLLSVCRFGDPRKGVERTVEAYAEIVRRSPAVPHLVLAGRGMPPEPLLRLIAELGLTSRVNIRRDLSLASLVEAYHGASVFLQTSYEEGLGISVLEAMACGLPVVATETAGSRETVHHGVTGWLISQTEDIATAVADRTLSVLADESDDLAKRGRERCLTMFSTEVAFRRFTSVYDELLAG